MNLPVIKDAKLPRSYERARQALAKCEEIDECKGWADRYAAMASYAKQADDKTLERMALKIRGRAVRRCGELLEEIEPREVGRPAKNKEGAQPISRAEAAAGAGLSPHQAKQALRVAAIPEEDFEAVIESEDPPTVEKLAKAGGEYRKAAAPPRPQSTAHLRGATADEYSFGTQIFGALSRLVAATEEGTPTAAARGERGRRRDLSQLATKASRWLDRLAAALKKDEERWPSKP